VADGSHCLATAGPKSRHGVYERRFEHDVQ
jgi:hypothetical protein